MAQIGDSLQSATVGASVSDVVVDNGSGAAVRAEINDIFLALVTCFSGATAPTTTYSFQVWANTSDGNIYQRSADNTEWIKKGVADQPYVAIDTSDFVLVDSTTQTIQGKKTFTGSVYAPTATAAQNDTMVASTAFVQAAITEALNNFSISDQLSAYLTKTEAQQTYSTIQNPRFTGTLQCAGDVESNVNLNSPLVRNYVQGAANPQWPVNEEEAITAQTLQKQVESMQLVIDKMSKELNAMRNVYLRKK